MTLPTTSLTYDQIFDAAAQILLLVDRKVTIHLARDSISIQFPTTRKLAEHLQIPHYYVLPYFAMMERDGMITRTERVGISTTREGTKRLVELMVTIYKKEARAILGRALFTDMLNRRTRKNTKR